MEGDRTMQLKYYFISVLLLSSIITDSVFSQTAKDSSYFPLSIGNQWIYKLDSYNIFDTVTVVDTQHVNGNLYYAVKEYSYRYTWFRKDKKKFYIVDTAAIRIDNSNIREYLVYDFSANIGQNWNVPLTNEYNGCDYGGKVTLESISDSVVTSMSMFTNCYFFDRKAPCRDDGIINEWFAQGFGRVAYVKQSISGPRKYFLTQTNLVTGIWHNVNSYIQSEYHLWQNFPNPFNPTTTITYSIPYLETGHNSFVQLRVYDVLGREVAELVNEEKPAGIYTINFNANMLASGIYFYQLSTTDLLLTRKMMVLQ
jgi:hypothetical protein